MLDSSQTAAVDGAVKQIGASLHATALELEAPYNPAGPIQTPGQGPGDELGGRNTVSLAHVFPEGQGIEIDRGREPLCRYAGGTRPIRYSAE